MMEKKTELQMKLWMFEEDEDCEGMTLKQLNEEFQKRLEQLSKNQQLSDISTSATSSKTVTSI